MSESEKQRNSSPVIQVNGTPSFRVQIDGKEEVLSVHDVAVRYIRSLFLTAKDFLSGVPIAGAVLNVPLHFTTKQMTALKSAAEEAGLIVLQIVPAPAAALTAYKLTTPDGTQLPSHPDGEEGQPYLPGTELDRTVMVVDVGGTSTSVSLVYARSGVFNLLSSDVNTNVGGKTIDDALVSYLSKEFTKKTKIPVDANNHRAWTKLYNEVELTKRTLSASNSAQCSVESLAEGIDFSHPVNRLRIDMCARKVWEEVRKLADKVLKSAGLEAAYVDEVLLVGGTSRLPGLRDSLEGYFPERTHITDSIDADQALARGCAVHAQAIAATPVDALERKHLGELPLAQPKDIQQLKSVALSQSIGILVSDPHAESSGALSNGVAEEVQRRVVDGQLFVTLLHKGTPLPARRVFELGVDASGGVLDLHEGQESVRVDKVERPKDDEDDDLDDLDDEEDEDDKFIEVRTVVTKASKSLGKALIKAEDVSNGTVRVELRVSPEGKLQALVGSHKRTVLHL